ncbi:MAG: hypothetical protein NTV48_01435 [Candidatus Vogelbacteria bacterium]|nr:hypothetical protein [Candidatus Vogelbacteria bacterium]
MKKFPLKVVVEMMEDVLWSYFEASEESGSICAIAILNGFKEMLKRTALSQNDSGWIIRRLRKLKANCPDPTEAETLFPENFFVAITPTKEELVEEILAHVRIKRRSLDDELPSFLRDFDDDLVAEAMRQDPEVAEIIRGVSLDRFE